MTQDKQVELVTGAGTGVGRAIALPLSRPSLTVRTTTAVSGERRRS